MTRWARVWPHIVVLGAYALLGAGAAAAERDYAEFNVTGRGNTSVAAGTLTGALAAAAAAACLGEGCTVVPGDVTLETLTWTPTPNATAGAVDYVAQLRVATAQYSYAVELATRVTGPVLGAAVAVVDGAVTVDAVAARGVRVVQGRPDECGDRFLQPGEQCDDGNAADGDGCSATCQLESGFMCRGFVRDAATPDALGHAVQRTSNGTFVEDEAAVEGCTMLDICARATVPFQPALWTTVLAPGAPQAPAGFYCTSFCDTFEDPRGWEMLPTSNCRFVDVDECARGETLCDFNAYCENRAVQVYTGAEGEGYTCRCDPYYFVSATGGMGCTANGVDIVLTVAGKRGYDEAESPPPDAAVLAGLRAQFIAVLVSEGYTTLPAAVVEEGCIDYPPVFDRVSASGAFATRGLWKLHVRLPTSGINLPMLARGDVLQSYAQVGSVFDDTTTPDAELHRMHTRDVCENDRARECLSSADCLDGGACLAGVPDIEVKVLAAGGALAPIEVEASGMEVISVAYDIIQTAWRVRVRYDNTVPNTINVLYLPHITTPVDNEELATFRHDEFACLPLGTGEFQQRRENTACCLPTFFDDYTTTTAFGEYLSNATHGIGAELAACRADGTAPTTPTATLLDGTRDFVTGPFARMARSYAMRDSVVTRGYQDVLLFLAEEDMRALGGVETSVVGGYRLRFFVGMAHLQGLPNAHLHSVSSHQEVTAEITESFVFTTSAAMEFTFVQDIVVDLLQVRNTSSPEAAPQYHKFARVGVSVPAGTTADEVHGIVPFSGARAAVGFSEDTAFAAGAGSYYPCLDVPRTATAAQLDAQAWCAFQDPLCHTLGPTPVTAGGQVYFIFPLRDDAWDTAATDRTAFFKPSLYLDFMLSTRDAGSDRILTRVQTRTEISPENIASMCDEARLESALSEILTVDLLLGLTPNATQMGDTLVQSLDVTRAPAGARHLERATSSLASNVLTVIVKGDDAVFTEPYAAQYGLEVEDFITMHFLDTRVRAQVEALMAAGQAFEKRVDPDSYTSMRIVPTDTLLALCPLQATRTVSGCLMRREIQARMPDITTRAVTNIAPAEDGSNANDVAAAAGDWAQALLGASTFVDALGQGHARTIADVFRLNNRFRRGFVFSPVIPWRQSELNAAGFATSLDLAQEAISVALVTLDKNVDARAEPIVQISIPAVLQVPPNELLTNAALRQATELSYAEAAEVNPNDVSINLESIEATTTGTTRRRRLLQDPAPATGCTFDVDIAINIQDTDTAFELAENIRSEATKSNSPFSKKLVRGMNRRVRAIKPDIPPVVSIAAVISQTKEIAAPVNVEVCTNQDTSRPPFVAPTFDPTGLNLGNWLWQWVPGKHGVEVSCTRRKIVLLDEATGAYGEPQDRAAFEVEVSPRGPQTDAEWQRYKKTSFPALSLGDFTNEWSGVFRFLWWDLCTDPPFDMSEAQQAVWDAMRAELTKRCCVCAEQPKKPGTKQPYVQQYSWPWAPDDLYNPIVYTNGGGEQRIQRNAPMFVNPQFTRVYASAAPDTYDTALMPPIADRPTCAAGEYLHSITECRPCMLGTYKATAGEYISFELIPLRVTLCHKCPDGTTTLATGSTGIEQCVCAAGMQKCPGAAYAEIDTTTPGGWSFTLSGTLMGIDAPWMSAFVKQSSVVDKDNVEKFLANAYNMTLDTAPMCAADVPTPCRVPLYDAEGSLIVSRCLNFVAGYTSPQFGDGTTLPCADSLIFEGNVQGEMHFIRYFTAPVGGYAWIMWRVPNALSWDAGTLGFSGWAYHMRHSAPYKIYSRVECFTGCAPCPRGTYRTSAAAGPQCTSCPSGHLSRPGATSAAQCHLPRTVASKYAETHLYEPALGLIAFNERYDPAWTDPMPFFRSNERRCAIHADESTVSCPDRDYPGMLPKVMTPGWGVTFYNDEAPPFPGVFVMPHLLADQHIARLQMRRTTADGARPGYAPTPDFSKTITELGISNEQDAGSRPVHFVEEIFPDGGTWVPNTVINLRLNVYAWSPGHHNVAVFISNKRLESDADWQHVLCSDKTRGIYKVYFCRDEPDPDNPHIRNEKNPYVVDGITMGFDELQSGLCWWYHPNNLAVSWWLSPTCTKSSGLSLRYGTLHWQPFVDRPGGAPEGPYFLYTVFTYRESVACERFQCAELYMYRTVVPGTRQMFFLLPGTEITYGVPEYAIPADQLVSSALYRPALGLVAPLSVPRVLFPSTGVLDTHHGAAAVYTAPPDAPPTHFVVTGQAVGPGGAPVLVLDESAALVRLVPGVPVVFDWSATPTHPLGVSTSSAAVVAPAATDVVQVVDAAAHTTTVTVPAGATPPPLFYLCSVPGHGFVGVPLPVDVTVGRDRRWCRLAPDGRTLECRQTAQSSAVTVYPELYTAPVGGDPAAPIAAAAPAPHLTVAHIPACGPTPYVVDEACTLQAVGPGAPTACANTTAHEDFVAAPVAGAASDTRYTVHGRGVNAAAGGACTATLAAAGMGCEHAASDTAAAPVAALPTLATASYAYTSTLVESDDGWAVSETGGWCPASQDTAPALTLDLGAAQTVAGIAVATRGYECCYHQFFEEFAVEASADGTTFAPVALERSVMSHAIRRGVAESDPATVDDRTVLLFASVRTDTRFVRILPVPRAHGCLRASALGVPDVLAGQTALRFDNTQTLEPYVSIALAPAGGTPLAHVAVFLPPRAAPYHFQVRAGGGGAATPLELPLCATVATASSPRAYDVQAERDLVAWRAVARCDVAAAETITIVFPLCATPGDPDCNPVDVDIDVYEVRAAPPEATFNAGGGSAWSWSSARHLGAVTTLAPGVAVYDTYTYPHLGTPATPGVVFASLADVHRQWCGVRDHGDLWLQLDLGARRAVGGLVVQAIDVLDPSAPALLGGARRVRIWHTPAAPFAWDTAADAGTFVLTADPAGTRLVFAAPLRARVLRVEVLDAPEACLRLALLDCPHACADQCAPGGVWAAAGDAAVSLPGTHTMLRVPSGAYNTADAVTLAVTVAALDPATHATAYTLAVTATQALAEGDRLFLASDVALAWTQLTAVPATAHAATAPFPLTLFRLAQFQRRAYAAPNPLLTGAPTAAHPYPGVHAVPSSTTGLVPAVVFDVVRGHAGSGVVHAVPKAAWHTDSFFEIDLRVGLLASHTDPGVRVHATALIATRELDDTDWAAATCARFRGRADCPVGMTHSTDYTACAPCAPAPDTGVSSCAGTPALLSLCADGPDPDDPTQTNAAHPDILDGVVVDLGTAAPNACCSAVAPRVVLLGADPAQHTDAARACCTRRGALTAGPLDTPGRIAWAPLDEAAYWFPAAIDALPACVPAITATAPPPAAFRVLDDETGPLPCRAAGGAFPDARRNAPVSAYTVFDRVLLPDKGWVLAALDAGDVATLDGVPVRRLAEAFAVLRGDESTAAFNGNIPNDPAVFAAGDVVFARQLPTTDCPEECESGTRDGVLRWAPHALDLNAVAGDTLYLYLMLRTGEPAACRDHNCQESSTPVAEGVVDTVALFAGTTAVLHTDHTAAPTGLRRRRRAAVLAPAPDPVPRTQDLRVRQQVARAADAARLTRARARESVVLHTRHLLEVPLADSDSAQSTTFARTTLGTDAQASVLGATCPGDMRTCKLLTVEVGLPLSLYCLPTTELIETRQRLLTSIFDRATGGKLGMLRVTSIYRPAFVATCVDAPSRRRALLQNSAPLDASLGVVVASTDPGMTIEFASADITLASIQRVYPEDADDSSITIALCIETSDCAQNATVTVRPGTPAVPRHNTSAGTTSTAASNAFLIVLISIVGGVTLVAFAVYIWVYCAQARKRVPAAVFDTRPIDSMKPPPLYHQVPQVPVDAALGYPQANNLCVSGPMYGGFPPQGSLGYPPYRM